MLEKYLRLMNWAEERTEGQGLAEYALILVLVSVVAFGALQALGGAVTGVLTTVVGDL